jgi:acyl-CoA synthetase (NDP forming)
MAIAPNEIKSLFARVKKANRNLLFPAEAESVLGFYGIKVIKNISCGNNIDEILQAAQGLGFPVVLKVISLDILHKSDFGCVHLNLKNRDEIAKAHAKVLNNIKQANLGAGIEGFLIQKMAPEGHETIIGLAEDPTFGKIILFGMGGIFVEVLKDVAIRKIPITSIDARDMIEEIKGFKIMQGARGKEPANLNLLQEILMQTSCLGQENEEIKELDLNPVFVDSQNAWVADPRIILKA